MQKYFLLLGVVISLFQELRSQSITVGTGGDYPTLSAAENQVTAGDSVILLDGTYTDGTQFLQQLNGTPSLPIVITAQNRHQAIFQGGTEAIHLINCSYLEIDGLILEQQTGNGINIDDGGDYSTPTHHITIRNCIFRDMNAGGNNDLLKLSGLDHFLVSDCDFLNGGGGGSGIDMVGCHQGVIQDNYFDDSGTSGIQAKGGTQYILIQRNFFRDIDQRAVNLGGSTGLQYFRPPLPDPIVDAFEAADLEVYSNIFVGSWSPIAYVGCVRVKVINNTIYQPENWVIRILQETTVEGFLPCSDNSFINNLIFLSNDLTEVNIGPDTDEQSFTFSHNLWYNASDGNWSPDLPAVDPNQVIADPMLVDAANDDFNLQSGSPAIEGGLNLDQPETDYLQFYYHDPPSIGALEGHQSTTAIPYQIEEQSIIMGPNPSANSVTISGDFTDAQIHIISTQGQILTDLSGVSSPHTIQLNELPTGMYFIRIKSDTHPGLWVERILKSN